MLTGKFNEIGQLKNYYQQLPWYKSWLFPIQLRQALEHRPINPFTVCENYCEHTWDFQRFLLDGLNEFDQSDIFHFYQYCIEHPIFQGRQAAKNFRLVIDHQSSSMINIVHQLMGTSLLNGQNAQRNFMALIHQNCAALEAIFDLIRPEHLAENIDGEAIFELIINQPELPHVIQAFTLLKEHYGFNATLQNLRILLKHPDPERLSYILTELSKDTFLTQQVSRLADQQFYFASIVVTLEKTTLLYSNELSNNLACIYNHPSVVDLDKAITEMVKVNLFTDQMGQLNFNAITAHRDPGNVAKALKILRRANLMEGILAPINFITLLSHPKMRRVVAGLEYISNEPALWLRNALFYFEFIMQHDRPDQLALDWIFLRNNNFLNSRKDKKKYYQILFYYPHAHSYIRALAILQEANLTRYTHWVLNHSDPQNLAIIIVLLAQRNLFDQTFINYFLYTGSLEFLRKALECLLPTNLLSGDEGRANFFHLINNPHSLDLLYSLRNTNLLFNDKAQANFECLMNQYNDFFHKDFVGIVFWFLNLKGKNFLKDAHAQNTFDLVMAHPFPDRIFLLLSKLNDELDNNQGDFTPIANYCRSKEYDRKAKISFASLLGKAGVFKQDTSLLPSQSPSTSTSTSFGI